MIMRLFRAILPALAGALCCSLAAAPAPAQVAQPGLAPQQSQATPPATAAPPAGQVFAPPAVTPGTSFSLQPPSLPRTVAPTAVHRDGGVLYLSANLGTTGPIRSGILWRIYADPQNGTSPVLVQESQSPAPSFPLDPGVYVVHATYGLASAVKRVVMSTAPSTDSVTINAGGLVIGGIINDNPIPSEKLKVNVFVPIGNDPEGRIVVENAQAGTLIRLPEGSYRVVSNYGDSNAIASADLKVETGQVIEAVMRHKAATVTLKLVVAPGTEALANTAFSVLTPGGDTIREAIGAFPAMTLAEGEYVAIARNGGKVYTQEFQVKAGLDRDIEVIAKDQPAKP